MGDTRSDTGEKRSILFLLSRIRGCKTWKGYPRWTENPRTNIMKAGFCPTPESNRLAVQLYGQHSVPFNPQQGHLRLMCQRLHCLFSHRLHPVSRQCMSWPECAWPQSKRIPLATTRGLDLLSLTDSFVPEGLVVSGRTVDAARPDSRSNWGQFKQLI